MVNASIITLIIYSKSLIDRSYRWGYLVLFLHNGLYEELLIFIFIVINDGLTFSCFQFESSSGIGILLHSLYGLYCFFPTVVWNSFILYFPWYSELLLYTRPLESARINNVFDLARHGYNLHSQPLPSNTVVIEISRLTMRKMSLCFLFF